MNQDYDFLVKLVCVGNSGVGKSSLIHRYSKREFNPQFVSTIGVDFEIKEIQLFDKTVKLQLWDCAGNERFRTITTSYYRGANVVMLVFDVLDESSMCAIPQWIREIREQNHDARILLVGNKIDGIPKSVSFKLPVDVSLAIEQLDPYLTLQMILTSAKKDTNVDEAFIQLTTDYIKEQMANPITTSAKHNNTNQSIHLHNNTRSSSSSTLESSCCS